MVLKKNHLRKRHSAAKLFLSFTVITANLHPQPPAYPIINNVINDCSYPVQSPVFWALDPVPISENTRQFTRLIGD
jgi:hypothetical protein